MEGKGVTQIPQLVKGGCVSEHSQANRIQAGLRLLPFGGLQNPSAFSLYLTGPWTTHLALVLVDVIYLGLQLLRLSAILLDRVLGALSSSLSLSPRQAGVPLSG